jgi:hypothetical protein
MCAHDRDVRGLGHSDTLVQSAYTRGMVGARRRVWLGRGRTAEAMVLLAAGSAAQKWVPMRRWSGWLGSVGAVPEAWRGRPVERHVRAARTPVEIGVESAIVNGSRRLPWEPSCLAQAAAAQVMLRRRGTGGVVVIGLRRSDDGAWDAHAWLMTASGVLTGGAASRGFTATSVFEVPGQVTSDELASSEPA